MVGTAASCCKLQMLHGELVSSWLGAASRFETTIQLLPMLAISQSPNWELHQSMTASKLGLGRALGTVKWALHIENVNSIVVQRMLYA